MTAPKPDKGPLGHAFVPCTNPEHAVQHCEFVMYPGIYDSLRCNQPSSAHKVEEAAPIWLKMKPHRCICGWEHDGAAPEPEGKAGASAEEPDDEDDPIMEFRGCLTDLSRVGWSPAVDPKRWASDMMVAFDAALRDAERAAEAAVRKKALEEAATLVAGHLGMREVANDIRRLARGGSQ